MPAHGESRDRKYGKEGRGESSRAKKFEKEESSSTASTPSDRGEGRDRKYGKEGRGGSRGRKHYEKDDSSSTASTVSDSEGEDRRRKERKKRDRSARGESRDRKYGKEDWGDKRDEKKASQPEDIHDLEAGRHTSSDVSGKDVHRAKVLAVAGDIVADAELGAEQMTQATKRKQVTDKAAETMFRALAIDPASSKKDGKKKLFGGFVNMMFLFVLVGCEIDLMGFALSFGDYWSMDVIIIQILLVVMPCGYLIAVLLYLFLKKPQSIHPDDGTGNNVRIPYAKQKTKTMDLQFYHFVPIFRYYLVIKEKTAEDIEATFRVNSLSSFTLGVAQISGMLFLLLVKQQSMTIFIKINIISQAVNWFITVLYFLTPVSSMMGGQLHVSSLNEKTDTDLRQMYTEYLGIRSEASNHMLKESQKAEKQRALRNFELTVHAEIYHIGNTSDDLLALDQIDMRSKLDALRLLRRKDNVQFSRIGS